MSVLPADLQGLVKAPSVPHAELFGNIGERQKEAKATAVVAASLTPQPQTRSVSAAFNTGSGSQEKATYSGKDSPSSRNVGSFSTSMCPAQKLKPKRVKT